MSEKRPLIVTFIGDISILGAFFFILSLFPKFLERLGIYSEPLPDYMRLSVLSENMEKVLIAAILLIISYGYLRLKRWGHLLMVGINLFSLVAWIILYQQNKPPFFSRNPIATFITLIFILPTIKYFGKQTPQPQS